MGTVAELRGLIDQGITNGLVLFADKMEKDMTKGAEQSEDKYYNEYSSWYDPYRRYDIKNMHRVASYVSGRGCEIKTEFSPSNMKGGHGFAPLHDDPGQVFTWGFETGGHGWYVSGTPVRVHWEQFFNRLCNRARPWAVKYVIKGLKSVGL